MFVLSAECELRGPLLGNKSWTSFCNETDEQYKKDTKIMVHCNLGHEMNMDESSRDVNCGDDGWEVVGLTSCYKGIVSTFR